MDKFAFCLWYGPQYRFAFGIATKQQIHLTWIENLGLVDYKCITMPQLFKKAADIQGWENIEGLALTIISDEMYEASMRIKHNNA